MSKLLLGLLCGLLFGAVSVATMIPLSFEDKRAAMLGALSIGLPLVLSSERRRFHFPDG